MNHSAFFSFWLVVILIAFKVQASSCLNKAELDSYALNYLQPLFSERAARLTNIELGDSNLSFCVSREARPTISISDHGAIFTKMWLDMTLDNGKRARYKAHFTFEKRVWRVKHSHHANDVLTLNEVKPDWQLSTRLMLNDTLFDSPNSHYKVLRSIRKNQILSNKEVAALMLVETGQDVVAKYHSGSIMLEVQARALKAGNLHDRITVLLSNQNEPVEGIIQNSTDVYVQH
ncbi:flagella basal body P-ring formation protein FlgA [Arsukibacterium perlucidum]|uniref:flagella basal body P-ring formation protein FlgA n=1 Tax=Arsukibacterium perlucidum TaxID=368811 RepID=UPI00146A52CB|nr:flagella basal body P-ring formation protein FlgA [Arsukibacterium perlucidum]